MADFELKAVGVSTDKKEEACPADDLWYVGWVDQVLDDVLQGGMVRVRDLQLNIRVIQLDASLEMGL